MKQQTTRKSVTANVTALLNRTDCTLLQVSTPPGTTHSDHAHLPPIAPSPAIDPITRSRIESLKRKQRADSFLASLTPEQCNKIYDWFNQFQDLSQVYALVIAPPPKGLGLEVCHRTLSRLRSSLRAISTITGTEDILDTITDMEAQADLTQGARVQNAMIHLLHEHAFSLARHQPGSESLQTIVVTIQKLSALEFQRQKLALERQRVLHQINSPASPRHHRVDLNIVPPTRDPAIIMSTDPQPASEPPPQLPSPPNTADATNRPTD